MPIRCGIVGATFAPEGTGALDLQLYMVDKSFQPRHGVPSTMRASNSHTYAAEHERRDM